MIRHVYIDEAVFIDPETGEPYEMCVLHDQEGNIETFPK